MVTCRSTSSAECAGKLGEDFDDCGRRIGIRFDVHIQERIDADHRHGGGNQNHDKRVIQRPLDEPAEPSTIPP